MSIKALIFDLDGVLVDTMSLHFQAWEQLAERYKRPFDQAMKDSFRGLPQRKCLAKLFATETLSATDIQDLLQEKNDTYQAVIRDSAADDLLANGVLDFLASAKAADLKLGIASSSVSARLVVEHTGLVHYADVVADGMTVNNGKPASDIFVWVAGGLQTAPRECIVFEDGNVGLQAARQAGMFTVGIGFGSWLEQAHWQFPQINSIQLDHLLEQATVHIKEAI